MVTTVIIYPVITDYGLGLYQENDSFFLKYWIPIAKFFLNIFTFTVRFHYHARHQYWVANKVTPIYNTDIVWQKYWPCILYFKKHFKLQTKSSNITNRNFELQWSVNEVAKITTKYWKRNLHTLSDSQFEMQSI